jgi:hypothetical protein
MQRRDDASHHDAFMEACARAGFKPDIARQAAGPRAAMERVAAGAGIERHQADIFARRYSKRTQPRQM